MKAEIPGRVLIRIANTNMHYNTTDFLEMIVKAFRGNGHKEVDMDIAKKQLWYLLNDESKVDYVGEYIKKYLVEAS